MTAIGATAVGVTAVRYDLKLWTIINIGSTIILWWSLFRLCFSLGELPDVWPDNFFQAQHPEDKMLHLAMDMLQNYAWQNITCIFYMLNPASTTTERCLPSGWICWQEQLGSSKPQEGY